LIVAAALCAFFSGETRREFQPVAFLPVPAAAVAAPASFGPAPLYPIPADPRAEMFMAVPKKRTSKMKTRSRKANWYAKAERQAELAWNRAKSAKANPEDYGSFSDGDEEDDDEEEDELE
jgi:hypothetical protein